MAGQLASLSDIAGIDLIAHGTTSDEETIKDTAVAQPLIVAAGLVAAASLFDVELNSLPVILAGHSVGEITAAALAGVLTEQEAMTFVRERANSMAAAAAVTPTGMSAVLGGDADAVGKALARRGLVAANVNTAGQVVAAGTLDALADLAAAPPEGARVRALDVAGAFHTHFMTSARDGLAVTAAAVPRNDPRVRLLGNADGAVVSNGDDVVRRLVEQVASPVRWDLCMQTMTDLGVTALIELPPAGTLTALARRGMTGVETLALKSPDDLDAARGLLQRHNHLLTEPAPSWRIAVAPVAGTFRPHGMQPGMQLSPGALVGTVVSSRDEAAVTATHGGVLVEWLAHDGDPVSPGQPVARLHPVPELVGA